VSYEDAEHTLAPSWPSPFHGTFSAAQVEGLPAPARRWLTHAIAPGAVLAREVQLVLAGSVVQGDRRLPLTATERLVPMRGFTWKATGWMGPLWVTVRDHYLENDGAVDVRLLGLVPMGGEAGPDTDASSRGRLAAESLWCPSMLLPETGVHWTAIDEDRARVDVPVDGVVESMVLTVEPDGRLRELAMKRWGNVGVDRPQRIPYGFRVLEERRFGAYTLASVVEGGWWYGTDRFVPANASRFEVVEARFPPPAGEDREGDV
jgi:hypothetical protein